MRGELIPDPPEIAPATEPRFPPERYRVEWEKQINAPTWPVSATAVTPDGRRSRWASDLGVDRVWEVGG